MKNNVGYTELILALIDALIEKRWFIAYYLASRETSQDSLMKQLVNFDFTNYQDKKETLKAWAFNINNVNLNFTRDSHLKPDSAIALAKILLAGDLQALATTLADLRSETTQQIDLSQTWLSKEQLSQLIEAIKRNKQLQKLVLAPCQETLLTPE
ncbi:MAG: hypothetical protein ACK4PR_05045, partial [Gammaproteobacteria bacterium]